MNVISRFVKRLHESNFLKNGLANYKNTTIRPPYITFQAEHELIVPQAWGGLDLRMFQVDVFLRSNRSMNQANPLELETQNPARILRKRPITVARTPSGRPFSGYRDKVLLAQTLGIIGELYTPLGTCLAMTSRSKHCFHVKTIEMALTLAKTKPAIATSTMEFGRHHWQWP